MVSSGFCCHVWSATGALHGGQSRRGDPAAAPIVSARAARNQGKQARDARERDETSRTIRTPGDSNTLSATAVGQQATLTP